MAETPELVLRSTRVVTPQGVRPAAVAVAGGRIAEVLPYDAYADDRVRDYGDAALLPGLVDTHVHVNDPGRAAWEGFATATSAAAAGGVTTVLDMPLNSIPPTTTPAHLAVKRATAETGAYTDVGFWGGAIPGNAGELRPLHGAGVFGFKCFLSPSGVEEFPELAPDELAEAMAGIAGFGGLLLVHAEDPGHLAAAPPPDGSRRYADFLASRPPAAELDAIARLVALARRLDARVHVLHLSSAEALPLIAAARASGVRITAETCPHFLTLTAEEIPDGATEFKCCPPIREAANQDALWAGLADGTIDCVVSDHSPCTPELKVPDFGAAWGGIASLQLGLPVVWTAAAARGFGLADVARWMATAPARLAGLDGRKGAIAPGHDADIAVLDPDATFTVDPAALHHRNPVTAYAGRTLRGVVRATWLRGRLIAENGRVTGPCGRLMRRQDRGAAAAGAADAADEYRAHEATRTIGAPAAATAPVIPRFAGAASPYRGGDPYADYRAPEPDTLPFGHLPDLASRRLGASVTAASDEFFAERENLTAPGPVRFDPAAYGHKGKAMDGWETRRRRGATADAPHPAPDDHDWAIVRLGAPGVVRGLIVDTAHFRGNHPNEVSVEGAAFDGDDAPDAAAWTALLPRTPVGGHAANAFTVAGERRLTHLRLCQYPDGGVARLRAHGEVVPDPAWLAALGTFDLAALEHGGVAEDASDRFFSPPANSIMPGRSRSMEEGWETRRRRDGGHDWVRYRLAGRAVIRAVEIDTGCYKGNAPGWAALSVADDPGADSGGGEWHEVLPRTRLWPDAVHRFVLADVLGRDAPAATHARLDVFPDGGVARLRLHGSLTEDGARHLAERHRVLSTAR